ncbi:hypothetical protein [Paenibacillus xylanexedens]|uniref:hypothetical protein n=1 Tax=Paenibacillus xylanexedens TaxID=528191 RepID=UPI000F546B4A|nr:hypothetical protein [Paenibacillus xylanexedens]RPK20130.1 hypothetical protein EDO6_06669 [Paenibacillus xylanexedens]
MAKINDIINVDIFLCSLVMVDDNGEVETYQIKEGHASTSTLMGLRQGDVFNIKGLGRLKILQTKEHEVEDPDFLETVELVLTCRKVSEWWDTTTTAMVVSTMNAIDREKRWQAIIADDFKKTWGEEYEFNYE